MYLYIKKIFIRTGLSVYKRRNSLYYIKDKMCGAAASEDFIKKGDFL